MERTLFQKRHYELFADLLRRLRAKHGQPSVFHGHAIDVLDDLDRELLSMFTADNPRFNAAKFKEACQP